MESQNFCNWIQQTKNYNQKSIEAENGFLHDTILPESQNSDFVSTEMHHYSEIIELNELN